MKRIVLIAVIASCKTQGALALDFDLSGTGSCGPDPTGMHFVVYAEPRTPCSACACAACFGAEPDAVVGCTDCTADDVTGGVSLDLGAGIWAVVLEQYDTTNTLVASQCIDTTVDSDGTSSATLADPQCAACSLGSAQGH